MFDIGLLKKGSLLKKMLLLKATALSDSLVTLTGTIVSFVANASKAINSLVVTIEPQQDLHGQDAPYPGGGGKNKFDESTVTFGKWTDSSGNVSDAQYGCVSQKIPAKASAYTFKYFGTQPNSVSLCEYASDDTFIRRNHSTGSMAQVTLDASTAYLILQVSCTTTDTLTADILASFKVELSESSTYPDSYSPYSNLCPITGWTGAKVWVKDEYDPTATPTATASFGQTVYGGEYEFVGGVGNSNRAKTLMSDIPDSYFSLAGSGSLRISNPLNTKLAFPNIKLPSTNSVAANVICNIAKVVTTSAISFSSTYDAKFAFASGGAFYLVDTSCSSVDDYLTKYEDAEFIYELDEPTSFSATGQPISTLQGQNNIWSDAGDVAVTIPQNIIVEGT